MRYIWIAVIVSLLAACGGPPESTATAVMVAEVPNVNSEPRTAAAYNNRGFARYDQGDLPGAISDFDQAIALDPKMADAIFGSMAMAWL